MFQLPITASYVYFQFKEKYIPTGYIYICCFLTSVIYKWSLSTLKCGWDKGLIRLLVHIRHNFLPCFCCKKMNEIWGEDFFWIEYHSSLKDCQLSYTSFLKMWFLSFSGKDIRAHIYLNIVRTMQNILLICL